MMRGLRRACNRFRGSFAGSRRDDELAEEQESHIQLLADEYLRRGIPPAEALRLARLQFGNTGAAAESYRDQRGLPALESIFQDLRYAQRWIAKNPGFAAVAILSLAIGIGANTAIFSVVNAVLLQPLRYRDPDRLFSARELLPHLFGQSRLGVNPVHAYGWEKHCPSIEQVGVMRSNSGDVADGGEPASIPSADVDPSVFAVFGVAAIRGRTFLPQEEGAVVLSERLWRSRFQADESLIGRPIRIDMQKYVVIGVMPESFQTPYPPGGRPYEMYRPLVLTRAEAERTMGNYNYSAFVRVRPGVAAAQAVSEMNVVQARFPALAGQNVELKAVLIPIHEVVTGRASAGLWMLAAAVGAVLLIVCLNLANLLLSRIAARTREAAIRTALGASRARLFRQVLTESLLLALAGGALGVLFAGWSVQALLAAAVDIPRLSEVQLDTSVLFYAFCLTVGAGLLFGTLPAWRLTRNDPQEALRAGSHTITEGRRGLRLREGLICLEVGLSAALLIVAGLLGSSLSRLLQVERGFDGQRILTVDVGLAGPLYAADANRERLFERLFAKAAAIPGVQAVGAITEIPTRGETWQDPIYLESDGAGKTTRHPVNNRYASPGYFRVMNIPLRQGRTFDEHDRGESVAVLSEKAAKLLWPGEANLVGRRFIGEDDKPKTLVGVVAEVRADLHRDPPPMAYYPYWQRVPGGLAVVVRTGGDPASIAGALRAAIREEDSLLPIQPIRTMEEIVDQSVAQRRLQLMLMAIFAAAALLVAGLGIYGVVAYSVARRRNEIGIRMALGARRSQLLAQILRQGMAPVVLGLSAGVAGALLLGQAIRGLLFEIEPADPLTIAFVAATLLTIGALACLIPARRAANADAADALRFE